jgi:enoyl-CoA hydratase/carnithine racemase
MWTLSVDDRIATLTLNRAEQKNSITPEVLTELRAMCAKIRDDQDIWAVILRTEGSQFSVGVDVSAIGQLVEADKVTFGENLRQMQAALDEFEALPQPTIAAIRGFCIGGGLLLTLCCDFRIASRNARFSFPEVKRGIAVIMGTQRITRAVGIARAKELVLLGDLIHADEAGQIGLVTRVVDVDKFDEEVEAFAAKFRSLPPRTISIAKKIADEGQHMTLRDSQDLEIELQAGLLGSHDMGEGVASFLEKRAPNFTGEY